MSGVRIGFSASGAFDSVEDALDAVDAFSGRIRDAEDDRLERVAYALKQATFGKGKPVEQENAPEDSALVSRDIFIGEAQKQGLSAALVRLFSDALRTDCDEGCPSRCGAVCQCGYK